MLYQNIIQAHTHLLINSSITSCNTSGVNALSAYNTSLYTLTNNSIMTNNTSVVNALWYQDKIQAYIFYW